MLSTGKEPAALSHTSDSASGTGDVIVFATPAARKIFRAKKRSHAFSGLQRRANGQVISLFEQESFVGFRQNLPVAISDGKSLVKVIFISTLGDMMSSDVAVMGVV